MKQKKHHDILSAVLITVFVVSGAVALAYASDYAVNTVTKRKKQMQAKKETCKDIENALAENKKMTDTIVCDVAQNVK